MNYVRLGLTALCYAILAQIVHTLGALATMKYYLIEEYFPVWSKMMMPAAGPPPASFMYYSFAFSAVTAIIFTLVYLYFKESIPGISAVQKGLGYGIFLILVGALPFTLTMYLLINLPLVLLISWLVETMLIYLLGGMIIAGINK